jgi:protein-S-isoprenylcysteine O-methyltransferase Ste14
MANFAAFALFFLSLLGFPGGVEGSAALLLAASGSFLAIAGAALVLRSRTELGSVWSFVPKADRGTGLITTGPYRLMRHPIYLGFAGLAWGQALAFNSWPAVLILLGGIVPTFAWRARAEETLLRRAFGESYARYRKRTGMIIPAWGHAATNQERQIPTLIEQPTVIQAAGNKPKRIEEYLGRVNSGHTQISIARMVSPGGWQEPGQRPEFEEITLVLRGRIRAEHDDGVLDITAGQAVVAAPGEWIRYSTPDPEGAEYVAVCLPAFSPESVHHDDV